MTYLLFLLLNMYKYNILYHPFISVDGCICITYFKCMCKRMYYTVFTARLAQYNYYLFQIVLYFKPSYNVNNTTAMFIKMKFYIPLKLYPKDRTSGNLTNKTAL